MRSMTSAIEAAADAAGASLQAERDADASKIAAAQRRAAQIDENRRIGAEIVEPPQIGQMSLDDMLARCVLVKQKGSPVVVIPEPGDYCRASALDMSTFVEAHRASIDTVNERGQARTRRCTTVWRDSPHRIVVASMALAIGRGRYIEDRKGQLGVNLWTPRKRTEPLGWRERVKAFTDHVAYLVPVPEERERFLDWLAHIEQCPEVLPHYGYLFWTPAFGIGRNWLASVLTRVWRGEVAPSVDLESILASGFNGVLSGTRLAIADEIRMGGTVHSAYRLEQRLRSIMTAEWQTINEKYGHMFLEFNCTRWLDFSNHDDALHLSEGDRRFAVVRNPDKPKSPEDYTRLYAMLNDPEFIESVGWYLATDRNLEKFNPGECPPLNAAKLEVIEASTPGLEHELKALLAEWEAPGAAARDLMAAIHLNTRDSSKLAQFGIVMRNAGWRKYGGKRKVRVRCGSFSRRESVWLKPGFEAESDEALAEVVASYREAPWYQALWEPRDGEPF